MAKILRRCKDCAHYRQQVHDGQWKCEKAKFWFRDAFSPDTIPTECPLDDVPEAPRWALVSEGQPKDTGEYWVCRIGPITGIPYYTADYWTGGVWMGEHRPEQNLAWQPILPLPRLPKEEVSDVE